MVGKAGLEPATHSLEVPAGRVRFFGSETNAEKDRSSGDWRYTFAAGKAKWVFRLGLHKVERS
jgi:hypothetical protein